MRAQGDDELRFRILDSVTFINDEIQPLDLAQNALVLDDVLVSGNQDVELSAAKLIVHDVLARLRGACDIAKVR
jgi:hypothetical protein